MVISSQILQGIWPWLRPSRAARSPIIIEAAPWMAGATLTISLAKWGRETNQLSLLVLIHLQWRVLVVAGLYAAVSRLVEILMIKVRLNGRL